MTKALLIVLVILALAGCGPRDHDADQGGLRSDMPLRSVQYFTGHPQDLAQTGAICAAWKASQRPQASWPANVINNCNNVDAAKTLLRNKADTDKLRKEAGI